MAQHTVEKIGGTSMTRFNEVLNHVILGNRSDEMIKNRVFVVSAYAGVTNALLEHKKTGEPGVYGYFARGDKSWEDKLDALLEELCRINAGFESLGLNVKEADLFIKERVNEVKSCLKDFQRVCSYGHIHFDDHLNAVREMLSAIGEVHSAYNSAEIIKNAGVNCEFIDLSGWKSNDSLPLNEKIKESFTGLDFNQGLVVATGYAKCSTGLMSSFDRGYSEMTFSAICVVTKAREGIIHKEFHLSSADPSIVPAKEVEVIGKMNFDMADQLADLGMEAIHPKASKGMELSGINLRVKNAFEPEHQGTLVTKDFVSPVQRVSILCGRNDLLALEVNDPEMVGESGYDLRIVTHLAKRKISFIAKNTNANTITHYLTEKDEPKMKGLIEDLKETFGTLNIRLVPVSLVAAIGSNLKGPGLLASAASSLSDAGINVLAINQCMRQVNMQFILERADYERALKCLHTALVANRKP